MISIITILIVILLDQVSKYMVTVNMYDKSIPLINGVFHLTYAENTGAAFGILSGNSFFLIAFTLLATILISYYAYRYAPKSITMQLCAGLIIGGAIGNLIDRIRLGYVVDFFDFRLINFAIFNVADSCVVCGAILFAIYVLFYDGKRKDENLQPDFNRKHSD